MEDKDRQGGKGEEQGDEVNYAYKLQQRAQHACDNNSQQSLGQRILDKTPFRQNYTQSNTDFCRNRRQAPESSFVILYYFFRLFLFLQHYLLFFVIMDARSAMRPCYILPMFFYFIFFYGRLSWPNGWTDLHETFTRGRYSVLFANLLDQFIPGPP